MNLNIENKILIPILFLVILPLLAVGIFYYRNSQNLFIKNMEDDIKDDLNEVQNIIRNDYNTSENDLIKRIYSIKEIDLIIYDINTNRLIHNRFGVKDNELLDLMNKEGLSNNEKEFNVTINDRLISFLRIEKFNWYVGTGKEISTLKSSLLEIHKYTILFAIIFLIIAVELSIFLAHNLSKPIKKLTNFCKKVSKGDYQNKIDIKRQDEFGLLANSFNEMIQKINQSTNKLKNLKEFNEDILRSTTTGIISVDQDGEVISINRAAKNILKKESGQEKIFMKLKKMTIKSTSSKARSMAALSFLFSICQELPFIRTMKASEFSPTISLLKFHRQWLVFRPQRYMLQGKALHPADKSVRYIVFRANSEFNLNTGLPEKLGKFFYCLFYGVNLGFLLLRDKSYKIHAIAFAIFQLSVWKDLHI